MLGVGQIESKKIVKMLRTRPRTIWLFTLAFAGMCLFARLGSAAKDGDKKSTHLRFSGVTVAGEGKKPQVYYLLNRKRIQLEHRPIEKDFLKDVAESLEQKPFKD